MLRCTEIGKLSFVVLSLISITIGLVHLSQTQPSGESARYSYYAASGSRLQSLFDAPGSLKLTQDQVQAMFFKSTRTFTACGTPPPSGFWSGLTAWFSPPVVEACGSEDCSGHYNKLEGTDCSGCYSGMCNSRGAYERGCRGHDYGCCCGNTTCNNE